MCHDSQAQIRRLLLAVYLFTRSLLSFCPSSSPSSSFESSSWICYPLRFAAVDSNLSIHPHRPCCLGFISYQSHILVALQQANGLFAIYSVFSSIYVIRFVTVVISSSWLVAFPLSQGCSLLICLAVSLFFWPSLCFLRFVDENDSQADCMISQFTRFS